MRKWLAHFSRWLFQRESSILYILTDIWMYLLIQLWCYLTISIIIQFSFIYFVILSFRCLIIVTCFNCYKWAFFVIIFASFLVLRHFAAYFRQFFLYLVSFLSHPFIRRCLVQSKFMHIFYVTSYPVSMCSYYFVCIYVKFI